ncbi:MAG: 3'(2'),5'-bisphosphate nucleotidase CysQ [Alphaproteobacteria bacterium]|nr:3'(2'),5'-bisphosphate nucleotidase CysQ [Alphaproteobacteria bacterium]
MPAPDADDLNLIRDAVNEAGNIARHYFGGDYKRWDKGKNQPVTEADIAIDTFLRDTLTAARPDYGWLSEETRDDPARLQQETVFIVDPIDGTTAFLKGKPHFSISVAVVHGGRPRVGVVSNPITRECFAARLGQGATKNELPIHVSSCTALEGCRILGPKDMFSHPAWNTPPNRPWPPMEIAARSSIAYRLALVADGTFDAALVLSSKHDWDMAAGDLIATEAGGLVTSHDGRIPLYNGPTTLQHSMICAGPELHAQILNRVQHIKLPRGQ